MSSPCSIFVRVCRRVSMPIAACYGLSSLDFTDGSSDGRLLELLGLLLWRLLHILLLIQAARSLCLSVCFPTFCLLLPSAPLPAYPSAPLPFAQASAFLVSFLCSAPMAPTMPLLLQAPQSLSRPPMGCVRTALGMLIAGISIGVRPLEFVGTRHGSAHHDVSFSLSLSLFL